MKDIHVLYKSETGKKHTKEVEIILAIPLLDIDVLKEEAASKKELINMLWHDCTNNNFDSIKIDNHDSSDTTEIVSPEYVLWLEEKLTTHLNKNII